MSYLTSFFFKLFSNYSFLPYKHYLRLATYLIQIDIILFFQIATQFQTQYNTCSTTHFRSNALPILFQLANTCFLICNKLLPILQHIINNIKQVFSTHFFPNCNMIHLFQTYKTLDVEGGPSWL
jgi:hypothetical protein